MVSYKIKTRPTGAVAEMSGSAPPVITSATGGQIATATAVSAAGFNPLDLLYGSLAACMVLSVRMAAQQAGMVDRLGPVRAAVTGTKAPDKPSRVAGMQITVDIAGAFDAGERDRLIADAETLCTISNTLHHAVTLHAVAGSLPPPAEEETRHDD